MPSTPRLSDESGALRFPGRAGRGVRVAVIDSGVNAGHPHIGRVAGGISIGHDGEIEENAFVDLLGHGTAVMAAIQEKATEADYFAVRVFHSSLTTSAKNLAVAIEWAIAQGMDIVNLSLGTSNPNHAPLFMPLISRASGAGVAFVSARNAGEQRCMPGCLPGVFGVELDPGCGRNSYSAGDATDGWVFRASGYPRPAPGIPREYNLQGISFAVANMSGFIARARESLEDRSTEALYRALLAEAR